MHKRIYEMAAQAISPSAAEQATLDTLCTAAEAELTMGLRDGVTPESCGSIYVFAAALMAAADLQLLRCADGAQQFTVGDVSIRKNQNGSVAAAALRRQALAVMAPFRNDSGFAFREVQG